MKIAIIQPRASYYIGGTEKVCLKHVEFLLKFGNEVVFYTIKPPQNYQYSIIYKEFKDSSGEDKNLKILEFEIPKNQEYIFGEYPGQNQNRWDSESILFSNLIFSNLQKNKVDIILTYYIVDSIFKPLNIPTAVYLGGFPRTEIEIYGAFLNFIDTVIYNSENVKNAWQKQISKSSVKQEFILGKAVNFIEKEKLNNPFPKDEYLNIVFAGRLIERKGVHKIIELIPKLLKNNLKVKLWILGDGPEKSNLNDLVEKLNLSKNVVFEGFVNNIYDYYYFSDLVILPSLYGEGLMGTVAEAMICGATIVTTKGVGNEEIICNNENGFLYEPEDYIELFKITVNLLENKDKRKSVGREAQEYAVKNFDWEKVVRKINDILTSSVNKK